MSHSTTAIDYMAPLTALDQDRERFLLGCAFFGIQAPPTLHPDHLPVVRKVLDGDGESES